MVGPGPRGHPPGWVEEQGQSHRLSLPLAKGLIACGSAQRRRRPDLLSLEGGGGSLTIRLFIHPNWTPQSLQKETAMNLLGALRIASMVLSAVAVVLKNKK